MNIIKIEVLLLPNTKENFKSHVFRILGDDLNTEYYTDKSNFVTGYVFVKVVDPSNFDHAMELIKELSSKSFKDYVWFKVINQDNKEEHFEEHPKYSDGLEMVNESSDFEEDDTEGKGLLGYKLKIASREICEQVQKHAFKLGYDWGTHETPKTLVFNQNMRFLFLNANGEINYSSTNSSFINTPLDEISVYNFLKLKK